MHRNIFNPATRLRFLLRKRLGVQHVRDFALAVPLPRRESPTISALHTLESDPAIRRHVGFRMTRQRHDPHVCLWVGGCGPP